MPRVDRAGPIGRNVWPCGVYSFYATKTITTGEGGMLVTSDPAIADRARQMSLHGISRDDWMRYTAAGSWYYEVEAAGFKYNMTDLAAAIGLVQLASADELLAARRALAEVIARGFMAPTSPLPSSCRRRAQTDRTRGTSSSFGSTLIGLRLTATSSSTRSATAASVRAFTSSRSTGTRTITRHGSRRPSHSRCGSGV